MSQTAALEASIRRSRYGEEDIDAVDAERSQKRRRLNSPSSSTITIDSGYNSASDEELVKELVKESTAASDHHNHYHHYHPYQNQALRLNMSQVAAFATTTTTPPTVGKIRRRLNSEPTCSSSTAPPSRKFASRVHVQDRQRHLDRRWSEPETWRARLRNDRDADLEIVAAQHQIAVARQCLYGRNNAVLPPAAVEPAAKKDLGCARPRIHNSTDVFDIFVDGCRVMDHERSFLSSLINSAPTTAPLDLPAPSVAMVEEEEPVDADEKLHHHFPGLVIPADVGNDDQDSEEDAVFSNDIECFFNLDEASSPSDGGCSL